jgi:hypothetical protein
MMRVFRPEAGECRISSEMWQEKNRFFSRTKFFDLVAQGGGFMFEKNGFYRAKKKKIDLS